MNNYLRGKIFKYKILSQSVYVIFNNLNKKKYTAEI
jgi:hypothetical protein